MKQALVLLLWLLSSNGLYALNQLKDRLDALQDREVYKINYLIRQVDAHFSRQAKAELDRIITRFYDDLFGKLGFKAQSIISKDELKRSFLSKLLKKYLFLLRPYNHDDEALKLQLGEFLKHLKEALSDAHYDSAISREQIGFREAIEEMFAENMAHYRVFLSLGNY